MELPISTEDIELTVVEVSGTVIDRRTEESEMMTFYRPSGNTVIVTLIQTLDKLGYDFRQLPDSVRIHDVKIPVKDLIPEEEPSEDDGQGGEIITPPDEPTPDEPTPDEPTPDEPTGDEPTGNNTENGDGNTDDGDDTGENTGDNEPTEDDGDGQSDEDDGKEQNLTR